MEKDNSIIQKLKETGKLDQSRLIALDNLSSLANRLASKSYLAEETIAKLKSQYDVLPDVISWGDYFATEIATEHSGKNDQDFYQVVSLVCFDLIAAVKIFSGKDYRFFNMVREQAATTEGVAEAQLSDEQREAIHLMYLMHYFENMGLDESKLSQADLDFFNQFSAEQQVG